MHLKQTVGLVLATLGVSAALLLPLDLDLPARLALGITLFTVFFWTFEPVPVEYTSLLVLLLFPLLEVIPFPRAFAAFSEKAIWLVFSGLVLSLGLKETALSERVGRWVIARTGNYTRLLLGLHLLGAGMAILVPSGLVRVLLLMPIVVQLIKTTNQKPGSPVCAALILGLVCSTYYAGTGILTASVPNLVILGIMESRGSTIYWGSWAVLMYPVFGLLRVACCYLLIRLIFPLPREPIPSSDSRGFSDSLTTGEKKMAFLLVLGVLLWASDAVHGIHPAYIGLLLVLLCTLPGWGPLKPEHLKTANFPLLIYIAAFFSLGYAMESTGLSTHLATLATGWLELLGGKTIFQLAAVTFMVVPFDFLMDTAAVAGILSHAILDFAEGAGLPALPVALSIATAAGTIFFPYQSAPFVVAYSFRYVRLGQFVIVMTLISLVTLFLLLPLNLLFWTLIGFI